MWTFLNGFLIVFILILAIILYKQKLKSQQIVAEMKPLIETVENIRDILYYCEMEPKLKYRYLSPTVERILGKNSYENHLNDPNIIFDIVHPEDYHIILQKVMGTWDFSKPITVRFKNHDLGKYLWFEEYAQPIYEKGQFKAVIGIFRNIDEKVILQRELEYKSTHDTLTGLYNREFFQRKLEEYNSKDVPISMIIVSLNKLKATNEVYGFKMGDQLIKEAAKCLKQQFSEEMILARISGDEFAVLLPSMNAYQIKQYIYKLEIAVSQENEIVPNASMHMQFGYQCYDTSFNQMEKLFNEASNHMYEKEV